MKILISFLLLTLSFSNKRKTDDDDVKITKKNDDMTNSNLECSHFRDCFNCSSFSYKKCGWDGNECFLISNSAQKINLSEIENSCYNFYDEEYKTSRCGKLSYSFEGKKIKSSLPKISNFYNDPTMLCVYTFNNTKQTQINFEFELEIDDSANVQYEVIFNDDQNKIVNVNNEVDTNFNNVKALIVRFSSNYAFSQQPFEIELENKENDDDEDDDDDDDDDDDEFNSLYVILIIVVVVVLVSCVILFIWCRKKQKKKIEIFNDNNIINNNIEIEKSSLNKKANENLEINENDIKNDNNKNNNNKNDFEGDKLNINKINTKNETENPDSLINEDPNIIDNNNLPNNIINEQIDNNNNNNKEQNLNHDKIINFIEKNFIFSNFASIQEKLNHKCSICIEEFKNDDNVAITPCHHIFHNNCIQNWLVKNNSEMKCPNCNYIFI